MQTYQDNEHEDADVSTAEMFNMLADQLEAIEPFRVTVCRYG